MSSDQENAKQIFLDAIERYAPEQWPGFLDDACGDHPALRLRVEGLLAAHGQVSSPLDHPVFAPSDATLEQPPPERTGTVVGPYKLLQKLGEGGMGLVYMAEQTEPVERRVALKIIKPGMDSRQVIARFEAERQALAMMDHPNIARVFDAGRTDSGRPYFVMELVKGIPITTFCDEHRLDPRKRLELFQHVCHGVQHAHQKGVIHRDLKPTNVLVAEYDDRAVPKIIDFGVARATQQRLTERTVFTEVGQVVGTIEYMSPEQAKLNQLDVDTRSDVYSLGVLLYELLTGETPLDRSRLRSAAFDELLRMIREEEPSRPSIKLGTSQSLPSIAANRHVEPRRLSTLIRGELDWIVMKALEKDRRRRYETASAFASDIERYLLDEPVQACPPSLWYLLRKRVRKNRAATVITALSLALLIAIAVGGFVMARRAREIAARDRILARQRLDLNRDLGEILAKLEGLTGQLGRSLQEDGAVLAEARQMLNHARSLASSDLTDHKLHSQIEGFDTLIAQEEKDTRLLQSLNDLQLLRFDRRIAGVAGGRGFDVLWKRYLEFFADAGLDLETTSPSQAAERLDVQSQKYRTAVLSALYGYRSILPDPLDRLTALAALEKKNLALLDAIDSDPWRRDFRDSLRGKGSLEQLEEELDVAAQPPAVLVWMADVTYRKGNVDQAIDLLRRGFLHHSKDHHLAVTLSARFTEEADRLRQAADRLADTDDGKQALEKRASDCRSAAVRYASIANALQPQSVRIWGLLADALAKAGRSEEAIAVLQALTRRVPESDSYKMLGWGLRQNGRHQQALAAFRKAVELRPDDPEAVFALAGAYRELDMPDMQVTVLEQAAESIPHPTALYFHLWDIHAVAARTGKASEALENARRAFLADSTPLGQFEGNFAVPAAWSVYLPEDRVQDAYDLYRWKYARHQGGKEWNDDDMRQRFRGQFTRLPLHGWDVWRPRDGADWMTKVGSEYARLVSEFLVREFPEDPLNHVYLAKCLRRTDPEAAILRCREALKCAPNNTDRGWAHLEIGSILANQGQDQVAASEYRKIADIPVPTSVSAESLERYVALQHWTADRLLKIGSIDEAIRAERLSADAAEMCSWGTSYLGEKWQYGSLPEIYLQLGSLYLKRERHPEALAVLEKAVTVDLPTNVFGSRHWLQLKSLAFCYLGDVRQRLGDLDAAKAAYREASRCRNDLSITTNIAWQLSTDTDPAMRLPTQALRFARWALQLNESSANGWSNLGVALFRNAKWEEAATAFETADSLHKGDLYHRMFFAMTCSQLGQNDRACGLFAEGVAWMAGRATDKDQIRLFREEAEASIGIQRLEEYYARAIQEQPDDAEPHVRRAEWYELQQRFDEATADYLQALLLASETDPWWGTQKALAVKLAQSPEIDVRLREQCPDDLSLWIGRLRVHASCERWDEAEAVLQGLLDQEQPPNLPYTLNLMALVKLHRRDTDGYVRVCSELLDRFPQGDYQGRKVRTCLLTPDLMQQRMQQIVALADESHSSEAGVPDQTPWRAVTSGLVAYRSGELDAAREFLRDALRGDENCRIQAGTILAMVEHREGNLQAATDHYHAARTLHRERMGRTPDGRLYGWRHDLAAGVLLREAQLVRETPNHGRS